MLNKNHIYVVIVLFVVIASLTGMPLSFQVGAIHSSVLEVMAFVSFLMVIGSQSIRNSPLWHGYLVLIASSFLAISIGISSNSLARVIREYMQVVYVSFFYFGFLFFNKKIISVDKLIRGIWFGAACFIVVFLIAKSFLDDHVILNLQYNWRIVIGLASIFLFASLLDLQGMPKIGKIQGMFLLILIMLYMLQLRTRAFFIMIVFGFSCVLLISLFKKDDRGFRRKTYSLFLLVFALVAVLVIQSQFDFGDQNALSRLTFIMEDNIDADVTALYRLAAWAFAAEAFLENPLFGNGFGTYILLDPWLKGELELYPSAMMHNTFLQILFVGGVTHLLGYIYMFYKVLFGVSNNSRSEDIRVPGIIYKIFFVSFLLYSAFGVTLFKVTEALLFWFITGYFSGSPAVRECNNCVCAFANQLHPDSSQKTVSCEN